LPSTFENSNYLLPKNKNSVKYNTLPSCFFRLHTVVLWVYTVHQRKDGLSTLTIRVNNEYKMCIINREHRYQYQYQIRSRCKKLEVFQSSIHTYISYTKKFHKIEIEPALFCTDKSKIFHSHIVCLVCHASCVCACAIQYAARVRIDYMLLFTG
jgi:hypothetical protein